MNQGQRLLFILISTALVAGIVTLLMYSSQPDYVVLFRDLGPGESGEVVDKLEEMGIPYRISAGGTQIEVPQSALHRARMQLAQEGLPPQGQGFEVFDQNSFGLTSFLQEVNYQRALQGELERTISQMKEIKSARVHLVLPKEELFLEEEKPPTASVVLELRSGSRLSASQIEAIAQLVANGVEGLDPTRVAIVDQAGNILASGSGEEGSFLSLPQLTATQLEVKKEVEESLTQRVQSMLESALGYQKAVVRVSADLDFERREGEKESFQPVTGGEGVVRSLQEMEEEYQGGGQAPGGVPGVASNIPIYAGEPESESESSSYSKRESTTNYEVNRFLERYASAPGEIKRLSVAVLVDSSLSPAEVEKIEGVVRGAVGINPERGDMVIVESLPFSQDFLAEEREALAAQRRMELITLLGKYGILALLVLVLYSLGRRILTAVTAPEEVTAEVYEELEEREGFEEKLQPVRPAELSPEEKAKLEVQKHMENEIRRLVQDNPEDAARLIRNWLAEE